MYLLIEFFYIGMPVVRTDGRLVYSHVISKLSRMGSLPQFGSHGAPLRSLRARELRYYWLLQDLTIMGVLTILYWYLISRFWRDSNSRGFIFAISTGRYEKKKPLNFAIQSVLNFIYFLIKCGPLKITSKINWHNQGVQSLQINVIWQLKIQDEAYQ